MTDGSVTFAQEQHHFSLYLFFSIFWLRYAGIELTLLYSQQRKNMLSYNPRKKKLTLQSWAQTAISFKQDNKNNYWIWFRKNSEINETSVWYQMKPDSRSW